MMVKCPRAGRYPNCRECYHSGKHLRITGCYGNDQMKRFRLVFLPCCAYCEAAKKAVKCRKAKED
jgi:hypothetical protein